MALLKCIECKHDVSEYAQHCMYCGCPASITLEKIEEEKEKKKEKIESYSKQFDDLGDNDIIICPECKTSRKKKDVVADNYICIICGNKLNEPEEVKNREKIENKTISKNSQPVLVRPKARPNIPKCPTCGSTNIEKISTGSKVVGAAMLGILSSDVRNTMHCKNCGAKW